MSGSGYRKTGWMRKRIDNCAMELKVFTTQEIQDKINSFKNRNGTNPTKFKISTNKLSQLLKGNSNIIVIERASNGSSRNVWEWIK